MLTPNQRMLIRSLKGSALSCYIVLHLAGRAVGTSDLVAATGYSANSVRSGLRTLEGLQLAVRVSRYDGWTLARGTQLLLPHPAETTAEEPAETPPETAENGPRDKDHSNFHPQNLRFETQNLRNDPQNLRVPSSSGSTTTTCSLENNSNHKNHEHERPLQQQQRDPQNLRVPLDPDLEPAVQDLIAAGAQPNRARTTVTRAALSWSPQRIEDEVAEWLAYCKTQDNIHYPAGLTCARIADAVPAPERPPETREEKWQRWIQERHDEIVEY